MAEAGSWPSTEAKGLSIQINRADAGALLLGWRYVVSCFLNRFKKTGGQGQGGGSKLAIFKQFSSTEFVGDRREMHNESSPYSTKEFSHQGGSTEKCMAISSSVRQG